MPHTVADVYGAVDHARRHHTGKIRFDLKVDVVGRGIVEPVARFGWAQAVQDVVSSDLVSEPQAVVRVGEGVGERLRRGVHALVFQHLYEGQVHVDVIVDTRPVAERFEEIAVVPGELALIGHALAVESKLDRVAVGDSDGLRRPRALDLVP